jgi:hypothetical protein
MTATENPRLRPWEEEALSRLPGSLCKAVDDDWTYRIELRDGRVIECSRVRLDGPEWIELIQPRVIRGRWPMRLEMERHVFIRPDEIKLVTEMDS